jgi:hypothetical protein
VKARRRGKPIIVVMADPGRSQPKVLEAVLRHPGDQPVDLMLPRPEGWMRLRAGDGYAVDGSDPFFWEVGRIPGVLAGREW